MTMMTPIRGMLLAGMLAVGACDGGGDGMKPTITIDEANAKVDDYISRAVKALPAEAKLELNFQERSGECTDPTDGGPKNRVVANRSYRVLGLRPEAFPSYFEALRSWWQANNFKVLDDKPLNEFLWVENADDGFQMTLKSNPSGGIFLLAGSPCVWPNGTPEPQALDAAPEAEEPAAAAPAEQPQVRKPRRAPVDDEDFDQTNWTEEGTY